MSLRCVKSGLVWASLALAACGPAQSPGLTDGGLGDLPPLVVPLEGPRTSWDVFSFIVPPGMSSEVLADGLSMRDPARRCSLTLLPSRAATGERAQQALDILLAWGAPDLTGLHDELGGTAPLAHQRRGVTASGQATLLLQGAIVGAAGTEVSPGRVMLVDVGGAVAPVIGVGGADCLDDPATGRELTWARFLDSLQFPGALATAPATLAQQVVGQWSRGRGADFRGETYAGDGRYAVTASAQAFAQAADGGFTGDGRWEARQNVLALKPAAGTASSRYFRILELQSETAPGGWVTHLLPLGVASSDGAAFEDDLVRAGP